MYKIYREDRTHPIWLPGADDWRYAVSEPRLKQQIGKADVLSFKLPQINAEYANLELLASTVLLFDGDSPIFRGRVLSIKAGMYGEKLVTCEGALAFLNDSIVALPWSFPLSSSPTANGDGDFLAAIAAIHNAQAGTDRQLTCTESGGTAEISVTLEDYETCFDTLMDNWKHPLSSDYPDQQAWITTVVTETNGVFGSKLTYKAVSGDMSGDQPVELGKNLLDITDMLSGEDIYTVIVPLGADVDTGETDPEGRAVKRPLTVAQVNSGSIFIENAAGIAAYGRIVKTVTFRDIGPDDDRTEAQAAQDLYDAGEEALTEGILAARTIEASAVDLKQAGLHAYALQLGRPTRVIHRLLGIDTVLQCTKVDLDLAAPEKSKYTFGAERATLTGQTYADARAAAAAQNRADSAAATAGDVGTLSSSDISGILT